MQDATWLKHIISIVVAWFVTAIGGFDTGIKLLIMASIGDLIFGVMVGVRYGELSTSKLLLGMGKKFGYLFMVMLACTMQEYATEFNVNLGTIMRTGIIAFFISFELGSVCKNLDLLDIPYPHFIKKFIHAISKFYAGGNKDGKV